MKVVLMWTTSKVYIKNFATYLANYKKINSYKQLFHKQLPCLWWWVCTFTKYDSISRYFLKLSTINSSDNFQIFFSDWRNMNPFKYALKVCDRKFTRPLSRRHIFITQSLYYEHLSVAGLKTWKLPFGDTICGYKFWQIVREFIFDCDEIVIILSRRFFAFAKLVLLVSNALVVGKEELFIKLL